MIIIIIPAPFTTPSVVTWVKNAPCILRLREVGNYIGLTYLPMLPAKVVALRNNIAQARAASTKSTDMLHMAHNKFTLLDYLHKADAQRKIA